MEKNPNFELVLDLDALDVVEAFIGIDVVEFICLELDDVLLALVVAGTFDVEVAVVGAVVGAAVGGIGVDVDEAIQLFIF